ncbi:sugar transferase [Facklamia sp. P13069]|uniref:sugar transferase n=1 Tax=Facklamia sp. P13069 TaxID=3421954 RepID=UPI003D16A8FF
MYKKYFKNILDFLLAFLLLPLVFILIIIIGIIIYLDDPGPIFYNAFRRGKNGKVFSMYKFRSMYVDSPDIRNPDGSTFNSSNDNRLTKFGKLLRKSSIDEIPQILNVLKGDMSFIGPRPSIVSKDYREMDEIRKKRLKVRPGITGYSQAFYRNSISQEEKYLLDGKYVEELSLMLDLKIFIQTIKSVFKKSNIFVD